MNSITTLTIRDNFAKNSNNKSILLYGKEIKNPSFCIVVPLYGKSAFFEETFRNLLQIIEDKNVQIILSDTKEYGNEKNEILDLLTDGQYNNVLYFLSERRLNQYENFNRCIELSTTEYAIMQHDDDLLCLNFVDIANKAIELMKSHNIGMIHEKSIIFNNEVKVEKANTMSISEITDWMICYQGNSLTGIPSCGTIFNKSAFLNSGGFDDEYPCSGDAFVSVKMSKLGYKIYNFSHACGYYRVANNISLKLSICQGFIKNDDSFVNDFYNENPKKRKMVKYFSEWFYSKNIESKVNVFGAINKEITIDSMDYKKAYKKSKKYFFRAFMHFMLKFVYVLSIKKHTIKIF